MAAIALRAAPKARPSGRIFILLSTYNGANYLRAQLESLRAQTYTNWLLHWRDDGSSDSTIAIMQEFTAAFDTGRCIQIVGPAARIGPAASFMTLLRAVAPLMHDTDMLAFADQDDVWLPEKLSRGVAMLAASDAGLPTLYCARLAIVDAGLQRLGQTAIIPERCGFPASLTQNIAVGCTVMLNHRASMLISCSRPPPLSMHDWWCYLLISAAGGRILVDDSAVALYRQHGVNLIGAPHSKIRRAVAALRRGQGAFIEILRQHLRALLEQPELLADTARPIAQQLLDALQGGAAQRLAALRLPGLRRQTRLESVLFRLWFLIG